MYTLMHVSLRTIYSGLLILLLSVLAGAQNPDDKLPVPNYGNTATEYQREYAAQLRHPLMNMRKHLCEKPKVENAEWDQRFFELLKEIIVRQHMVVWVEAGNFAPGEERSVSDPTDQIRRLLMRAANDHKESAKELNRIIQKTDADTRDFMAAANGSASNRSILKLFAIRASLASYDKELANEDRLKAIGIHDEYHRLRKASLLSISRVLGLIYSRTIPKINALVPASSPRFVIYGFKTLNISMSQFERFKIATTAAVSSFLPSTVRINNKEFSDQEDAGWYMGVSQSEFSEPVQQSLRGDCGRTLRIKYIDSRREDADKAMRIAEENNYTVELVQTDTDSKKKGKLFYMTRENAGRAAALANKMLSVESLTVELGRPASDKDKANFEIWLVAEKGCGTHMDAPQGSTTSFTKLDPATGPKRVFFIDTNTGGMGYGEAEMFEFVIRLIPSGEGKAVNFQLKSDDGRILGAETGVTAPSEFKYCVPYKRGQKFTIYGSAYLLAGSARNVSVDTSIMVYRVRR